MLLELVSFYNEEDQIDDELLEERWLKSGTSTVKIKGRKTWK